MLVIFLFEIEVAPKTFKGLIIIIIIMQGILACEICIAKTHLRSHCYNVHLTPQSMETMGLASMQMRKTLARSRLSKYKSML